LIDYTYWQHRIRVHLNNEPINYIPINLNNHAHFLLGMQDIDQENEEKFNSLLLKYNARIDRQAKWLFYEQGEIILSKRQNLLDEDTLMIIGLSGGAKEVYFDENDLAYIICEPHKLTEMCDILELEDVEIFHALLSYRPQGVLEMYEKNQARIVYEFCEKIAELSFVADICADFAIGEVWIAEFEKQ